MTDVAAHPIALGDRGRVVVPLPIRERHDWQAGTPLVAVDTEVGVLLMSANEALDLLRSRLEGRDLVAELLSERASDVKREER